MGEPHGATQVLTWSVTICSQSQHTAAGEVSCWSYVGPTTNTCGQWELTILWLTALNSWHPANIQGKHPDRKDHKEG